MPTSREMLPRQRTDGASHRSFRRWSDELYCAGALDQRCPALGDSVTAGRCYWEVPPTWRAATEDDMNRTLHFQRWSMDRFNPPAAGVGSEAREQADERGVGAATRGRQRVAEHANPQQCRQKIRSGDGFGDLASDVPPEESRGAREFAYCGRLQPE